MWAVDFIFDATADGDMLKILTISDEYSKACLATFAQRSIKATNVIEVLERLMTLHGPPNHVRSDNGPEFVAQAIQRFLAATGLGTMFIEPGSPWQNPFAETFHARLRDELLDHELFQTVLEAQVVIEQWRRYFNEDRPHGALNDATPIEVLNQFKTSGNLTMEPTP